MFRNYKALFKKKKNVAKSNPQRAKMRTSDQKN